jgi:tetratricopeptide (TPR) repeat protein
MTSRIDPSRLPLFAGLLLALLALVAFLPVLGHDFVRFDDPLYVTQNAHVRAGLTWEGIAWALTANVASNWHPLTMLSHMLDATLFGLNPRGHHLTSLVLHVADTVLLFLVFWRMTGKTGRSAAVAALFAVHPTHVESVAWVAERKDVLSALFWMLALLAYHRYAVQPSRGRYAWIVLWLALGLMSKPMVVTLPFVLLLLDVWPLGRLALPGKPPERTALWRLVREKLPLFALAAAGSVVTVLAQHKSLASAETFPVARRLAHAVVSYVAYLGKTLAPRHLAVYYPMPGPEPAWEVAGALLLLAGITALALLAVRRAPYLLVGWLWFLGTLVPVIGLVQVGGQSMADRYTYLPSIGLYLMIVWGLADLLGRRPAGRTVLAFGTAVVLTVLVGLTRVQLATWRDSEALFEHAVAVTDGNYLAHLNLAQILAGEDRREESLAHFRAALALAPGMVQVRASLGNTLRRWGQPAEALPHLRAALILRPRDAELHHSLAMDLVDLGRTDQAMAELRTALRLDPKLADAHYGLGLLLQKRGEEDEALAHYRAALASDPTKVDLYAPVGSMLARRGRLGEALPYFAEAVRRQPDSAAAHYNLAVTLRSLGREEEAQRELDAALALDPGLGRPR